MTPVSPFLSRSALALIGGGALATLAVALAPGAYYDLIELRLAEFGGGGDAPGRVVTVAGAVADLLMAVFVFLVGKEAWEAVTRERGGLSGRHALAPAAAAAGGMAGAALVWAGLAAALGTGEEAAPAAGWEAPLGADLAAAYLFARPIFGRGHPALQLVLFVAGAQTVVALVAAGLAAPAGGHLAPLWLLLPLAAALAGWRALTLPARRPGASERDQLRAEAILPWAGLAAVSWVGVALSGLPPALGLLPVLPAMPRAGRSFGLFAVAESFLHDPANRLAWGMLRALAAVMFLFGLTHGGLDPGATGAATWVALGALAIGKPLGFLAGLALVRGLGGPALPRGIGGREVALAALLSAAGFTGPVLAMAGLLPPGEVQEGARLGFALSLLAGPAAMVLARLPRRRA